MIAIIAFWSLLHRDPYPKELQSKNALQEVFMQESKVVLTILNNEDMQGNNLK